jgi:GDPmannose 4,6-dehydratase
MKKKCLIIGSGGQDGSYACELYLEKGYEVWGTIRRSSIIVTERIDHIFDKINLVYCDITDPNNVLNIISKIKPDVILNFAAQSHVKISSELENYTFQTNTIGLLNILQAVRSCGLEKTCRIYHSGTSEQFGNETDGSIMLNENSLQVPVSIYGISKVAANQICNMYRDAFGMFIVCSILFNHESPRRAHNFVTQKIARYVGQYNKGCKPLQLGNLYAKRDWGHAKDYVEAISLMLESNIPDNYIIATGETHSVKEFVELAFKCININIKWKGSRENEIGINDQTGDIIVQVNPKYYRDIDIECLIGDATKANRILGWYPKTSFKDLVKEMVFANIKN